MLLRRLQAIVATAGLSLCLLLAASVTVRADVGIETSAEHAFMIDLSTQTVLLDKQSGVPMPPASMSKLMTAFMVFERLKAGHVTMQDTLPVSEKAWRKGGSKMFVEVGSRVSIEDLLKGIIVQSGNDACIVVAEGFSGSEAAFAEEMTARARTLGLVGSTFRNATGWPDPGHLMSARDLAKIAQIIIEDFPEYYDLYSLTDFTFNGIEQANRNPLLYTDSGADGLKTGHTSVSGYGLTASAERDGRRLILVLNGLQSARARAQEAERLLEWGFRAFETYPLLRAGETVEEADVWLGEARSVPLVLAEDLTVTLERRSRPSMAVKVQYDAPIQAPVMPGDRVGTLTVTATGIEPLERPLVAGGEVPALGTIGRLMALARAAVVDLIP